MNHNDVRKGIRQTKNDKLYGVGSFIIFMEMIFLPFILGQVYHSWWVFGGLLLLMGGLFAFPLTAKLIFAGISGVCAYAAGRAAFLKWGWGGAIVIGGLVFTFVYQLHVESHKYSEDVSS